MSEEIISPNEIAENDVSVDELVQSSTAGIFGVDRSTPSAEEAECVLEVKQALGEWAEAAGEVVNWEHYDDLQLLRFARARKCETKAVLQLLTDDVVWRRENRVDSILEWGPKEIAHFDAALAYWPSDLHGADVDGDPIYVERIGSLGAPGSFMEHVDRADLILFHIWWQERVMKAIRDADATRSGPGRCYGMVGLEDMQGLGFSHLHRGGLSVLKEIFALDSVHYPEILKLYVIFNAPSIATMLVKMISPWVDPGSMAKVRILSSGHEDLLREFVPLALLPHAWGGDCECQGSGFHCVPGCDNRDFEWKHRDGTSIRPHLVTVSRRDTWERIVKVRRSRRALRYRWWLRSGADVGFVVYRVAADGAREELLREDRARPTKEAPLEGELDVEKHATYAVVWDNSYSMIRKKEIEFELHLMRRDLPDSSSRASVDAENDAEGESEEQEKKKKKKKKKKKEEDFANEVEE